VDNIRLALSAIVFVLHQCRIPECLFLSLLEITNNSIPFFTVFECLNNPVYVVLNNNCQWTEDEKGEYSNTEFHFQSRQQNQTLHHTRINGVIKTRNRLFSLCMTENQTKTEVYHNMLLKKRLILITHCCLLWSDAILLKFCCNI